MMGRDEIIRSLSRSLMQSPIRQAKETGSFPPLGDDFDFLTRALSLCRTNNAQLAQDLWVLHETCGKRGGYFVEFGAGDGVILSNTCLLEANYGWRGALAEPNPFFHNALRRNRRAFISTRCVAGVSGLPIAFNQTSNPHLATMDRYSLSDCHANARSSGTRITVQTQSLRDLLIDARAPKNIDYLSIDTEGSEYEVLSAFDFSDYNIALVTVEHNHTPQEKAIDRLLGTNGFERKFAEFTDFDAWYVNPRFLQNARRKRSPARFFFRFR